MVTGETNTPVVGGLPTGRARMPRPCCLGDRVRVCVCPPNPHKQEQTRATELTGGLPRTEVHDGLEALQQARAGASGDGRDDGVDVPGGESETAAVDAHRLHHGGHESPEEGVHDGMRQLDAPKGGRVETPSTLGVTRAVVMVLEARPTGSVGHGAGAHAEVGQTAGDLGGG